MPQGKMTYRENTKKKKKKASNFVEERKQTKQFIQCFQSTEGKEKM